MSASTIQQGFILNKSTFTRRGKVYVELWVKTPSSTARLISSPQYPTCFVSVDHANDLRNIAERISAKISISDDGFHTLEQVPVATVKTATESHMHQLRQHAQESSIVRSGYSRCRSLLNGALCVWCGGISGSARFRRYASDRYRKCANQTLSIQNHIYITIDIECNEHEELFSIALAGEGLNVVLLLCPPRFVGQTLQGQKDSAYELITVESEKALLEAFFSYLTSYDPDIILGWNVKQFDMAVLERRARANSLNYAIGRHSREASVRQWEDQTLVDVPGRCVIDGIEALKTMTYQFESFSLDHVSEELLGENKLIQAADKLEAIKSLYHSDPVALANYNFKDTELVNRIQDKTQFIDFLALQYSYRPRYESPRRVSGRVFKCVLA